MPECVHGGDLELCPPCNDGPVGRRLADWQLVTRKAARWPARCATDGCDEQLGPGDRAAFWRDLHRPDDAMAITCALCTPDGRPPPLEAPRAPGAGPPCPRCASELIVDHSREWNGGRMKPVRNPRPAWCPSCSWRQTLAKERQ
jgi:hypothetical protein